MLLYAAVLNYHRSLLGLFFALSSGAISVLGSEDQGFVFLCLIRPVQCKSSKLDRWVENGELARVR